ncbi:DNA-binding protein [Sinorhizobium medicae]|nr:DNA-binding protein [Sinorhizobium medicae]MDX0844538.1 DNA-binding protein [Sinorhizobium medicae]
MGKRYLTRRQVRERYGGIADVTVRRWIDAGRIDEPLRIGNRDYFDEDKLDERDRHQHKAAYRHARANPSDRTPPQEHT